MDTTYVNFKEGAQGGTIMVVIITNIGDIRKYIKSDQCGEEHVVCVFLIVFLSLSICLHTALEVLIGLLARRERKNAEIRKKLESRNQDQQTEGDNVQDFVTVTTAMEEELRDKAKLNDRINAAILVLTVIGIVLNLVINELELS